MNLLNFPLEVYYLILSHIPVKSPLRRCCKTLCASTDSYPNFKRDILIKFLFKKTLALLNDGTIPSGSKLHLYYRLSLSLLKEKKIEEVKSIQGKITQIVAEVEQRNSYESLNWRGALLTRTLHTTRREDNEKKTSLTDDRHYHKILSFLVASKEGQLESLIDKDLFKDSTENLLKLILSFLVVNDKRGGSILLRRIHHFLQEGVSSDDLKRLSYPLFSILAKKFGDMDFAEKIEADFESIDEKETTEISHDYSIPNEVRLSLMVHDVCVVLEEIPMKFEEKDRAQALTEVLYQYALSERSEEFAIAKEKITPEFDDKRKEEYLQLSQKHEILPKYTYDSKSIKTINIYKACHEVIKDIQSLSKHIQADTLISLYVRNSRKSM